MQDALAALASLPQEEYTCLLHGSKKQRLGLLAEARAFAAEWGIPFDKQTILLSAEAAEEEEEDWEDSDSWYSSSEYC